MQERERIVGDIKAIGDASGAKVGNAAFLGYPIKLCARDHQLGRPIPIVSSAREIMQNGVWQFPRPRWNNRGQAKSCDERADG